MAMAEEPSSEALCSKEVEIEAEKPHPLLPLSETSLPQSESSISSPVTCTTTPSDLGASPFSPPEKSVEVKDSGVEIVAASDSAVNNSTESFNGGNNDGGAEQRSPSHVTPGVSAAVSGNSFESSPIASVTVDGMRLPLVAVPCFIAPAALLETSGFASHFAITHQAVLATVTAQAQRNLQSGNIPQPAVSPMPIASTPEKLSEENILSPETDQEQISHSKTESPRTGSTKTPIDGFNWRKYGQKHVKGTENARSYYRCTHASCTAKKKVEHRYDGHVLEVVYRGGHNHSPPPKARFSKEKRPLAIVLSEENQISTPVSFKSPGAEPSPLNSVPPNFQGSGCDKRLHCSSDCEADGDAKGRGTHGEAPDLKRRSVEESKFTSPSPLAIVIKTAKEPKVIRHLTSDPGSLSDGYRWRKYGQKFVKGNPNPRSYYRCTQVGCPARKHVEKDSTDDGAVIINYEGKHNHDLPPPKTPASTATVANCPPPAADLLMAAAAAIEAGNHIAPISTKPPSSESAADSSLESAQTLLSIGGARPLFDDHRPAVSVQNS